MSISLYYNQVLILPFHPVYLLQTGSAAARDAELILDRVPEHVVVMRVGRKGWLVAAALAHRSTARTGLRHQLTVDDRVRAPLPFEARATDRSVDGVRGLLLGVEVGEPDWPVQRAQSSLRPTCIQTDVFTRCLRNTTVRRGPLGSLKHEMLRLEPRRAADRGARRRGGGAQHDDGPARRRCR